MIRAPNVCSLKERVFKSSGSEPLSQQLGRQHKYKLWTEGCLTDAVKAVEERGFSVRHAAEEFSVPKSTLHDRVSGKHLPGLRSGPEKYLTDEEETELEEFLIGCALVGYAKSRFQVIELVQELMKSKGRSVPVSHGWWESFRRRHPNIAIRTASPLSYSRIVGSDPRILGRYFDLLQHTLQENELLDRPSQVFNLDETGLSLDPKPPHIVAGKGTKNPSAPSSGDRSQITVLACCSASGYALPPLIIFDRMNLRPELTKGEVPGTIYGLSRRGWIDSELFELWVFQHFLTHVPQVCPILVLMDGHSSHHNPAVITHAAEEGVILFTLPPHTSHLTQPLDKGCFGPLKVHWRKECWQYVANNPTKVVTRYQFSSLFRAAWEKGMTMTNIIAGFRTSGIFPLNREAVLLDNVHEDSRKKRLSLSQRTGLSFIPLYSLLKEKSCPIPRGVVFDTKEIELFQRRYEEGYDLPDERYQSWVHMYHPQLDTTKESSIASHLVDESMGHTPEPSLLESESSEPVGSSTPISSENVLPHTSYMSRLLCNKIPKVSHKTSGQQGSRVLTSAENISNIRKKERKKKEEAELKKKKN